MLEMYCATPERQLKYLITRDRKISLSFWSLIILPFFHRVKLICLFCDNAILITKEENLHQVKSICKVKGESREDWTTEIKPWEAKPKTIIYVSITIYIYISIYMKKMEIQSNPKVMNLSWWKVNVKTFRS